MECPYCRSKVYVYRRKTMTPEFRCRDCEATWDDPYIDGHVEPSFKRTLEGGCPECGARGYNNYPGFVEGRGELSGSLNDPYPEENYMGCIACGNEWAISDYVQEQEEFEAEMKRYAEMDRERRVVPSRPLNAALEEIVGAVKDIDKGGVLGCVVIAVVGFAIFMGIAYLVHFLSNL